MKHQKIKMCLLVFVLMAIVLWFLMPYICVPNDIPGQMSIDPQADEWAYKLDTQLRIDGRSDPFRKTVLEAFAGRGISGPGKAGEDGRGWSSERLTSALAKMHLGIDLDKANRLIQEVFVWGNSGSSWEMNPEGDYDFVTVWMIPILYDFGDNPGVLYPQTLKHLTDTLLIDEGKPVLTVPKTAGRIFDTENHLLMREGSRYLKNQWMYKRGGKDLYNNKKNGMEKWLRQYLKATFANGVYEYNSDPYATFTFKPLMNVAQYADDAVIKNYAIAILDNIIERYAYGSLTMRQSSSFRRQLRKIGQTGLRKNSTRVPLEYWTGIHCSAYSGLSLMSALYDYTPKQETINILTEKPFEYLAIFAHHRNGSPEIYSGSSQYLLSSGGAYRGRQAKVIPRPICLLLNDDAGSTDDCIHIRGLEEDMRLWNMSGVYQRFAIAEGRVIIPDEFRSAAKSGHWSVVDLTNGVFAGVYSANDVGCIVVSKGQDITATEFAELLNQTNPVLSAKGYFTWHEKLRPDNSNAETIHYNTLADNKRWVITGTTPQQRPHFDNLNTNQWQRKYIAK